MFARAQRYPRSHFTHALKSGRRVHTEYFSAVVPREGTGYAVVIAKKTAKSAVLRHRMKRRVFSALRALERPTALILFPKAAIQTLDAPALRDELEKLIAKIGK